MVEEEGIDHPERASETKRKIGRSISINGVHAVDATLTKATNLEDPIVDLDIKVNNPIGRLWLALKRIWRSQNTIVSLKFTIPLLVLPIALYVIWVLWQGRGVNTPRSLLGVIHQVTIAGAPRDILIVPSSDVYMVSYGSAFNATTRLTEKPVIAIGTYSTVSNTLTVESLVPYNTLDLPKTSSVPTSSPSVWDTIWAFIEQFR